MHGGVPQLDDRVLSRELCGAADDSIILYHWTHLRRGLRAKGPSIILCAKMWSLSLDSPAGTSPLEGS